MDEKQLQEIEARVAMNDEALFDDVVDLSVECRELIAEVRRLRKPEPYVLVVGPGETVALPGGQQLKNMEDRTVYIHCGG